MIGVLLTSTCYYPNIEKQTFADRVDELAYSINRLDNHIRSPYELIIADNSPPDHVPSEKILKLRPASTIFIRETENPGKSIGEATLIRDGVYLSHARGHRWLLKLTGRYFLTEDWSLEKTVKMLEERGKHLYVNLNGKRMADMPWAKKHPLYEENLDNDKLLIASSTQAFMVRPEYLIANGVFEKRFLYQENEWVNFEQLFWLAIKDLDFLHWPELPINGWEGNKYTDIGIKSRFKTVRNQAFEITEDYKTIPQIDPTVLLDSGDLCDRLV